MSFTPKIVLTQLAALTGVQRFLVALSGGVDSTVLLHTLVALVREGKLTTPFEAIHVHHGLSPNADQWRAHCRTLCQTLNFDYHERNVQVDPADKQGVEAAARRARYAALQEVMSAESCLLMAHHADDQAETLMLQLLRGSGPQGLSAMPRVRPFGAGRLLRPLLDVSRDDLVDWAKSQHLTWIEDESNREIDRDRNFLRWEALPVLRQRWPSLSHSLSRSARLCAELSLLVREQAATDREAANAGTPHQLLWPAAARLDFARRKNLLRYWIVENGRPLPNSDRLEQMAHELWEAGEDRQPLIHWPGVEVRRYRERLYIGKPLGEWAPPARVEWDGRSSLELGAAGRLTVHYEEVSKPPGLALCRLEGAIEIRFRGAGAVCTLAGREGTRPLKKVLQELAIEPWLRDRTPLIYCNGQMAAIADRAVCEGFQCPPDNPGVTVRWHPSEGD